jgi:hypothetical protein
MSKDQKLVLEVLQFCVETHGEDSFQVKPARPPATVRPQPAPLKSQRLTDENDEVRRY